MGLRWLAILSVLVVCLPGCESLGYYWQASSGHLALLGRKQAVADMLQQDDLSPQLRQQLVQVVAIRDYAASELALPVAGNYQHLVQLDSNYVTWNVVAAPPLSMELERWCFWVAGCVSYRGYFDQHAAQEYAAALQADGYDTSVGGVTAYSTLGWFNDPLLSSFLRYDDMRLAALLFHELAHQVVYVKNDTSFNESFASAVEELAVAQWLHAQGREEDLSLWKARSAWDETFIAWLLQHRDALDELYQSNIGDAQKLAQKQALIAAMQVEYPEFRQRNGGDHRYDRWMQQPINNARLLSIGSYTDWLAGFKHLFQAMGCDWPAFYQAVESLAAREAVQRTEELQAMQLLPPAGTCADYRLSGDK
jgi:predicted aminopeptidase